MASSDRADHIGDVARNLGTRLYRLEQLGYVSAETDERIYKTLGVAMRALAKVEVDVVEAELEKEKRREGDEHG